MLVYDQILDRVKNYKKYGDVYKKDEPISLIENFNIERLQSVSYDVSMGNKIRKFKDKFKTIYLDEKNDIDNLFIEEDITNGYKLIPGEYILVRLNEKLNMPNDLAGHIRPRTTFNKLGLIITSQHINPSYSGNLQIGIKNETPNVVILKPGLVIGQVVFEKVDDIIREDMLYKNKKESKYQDEDNFVGSKIYDEDKVKKAKYLYKKLIKIVQE
ncbi:MAG: dCTP deaminase [Paraclostridium sordellii]